MSHHLRTLNADDFADVAQLEAILQPQDGWGVADLQALDDNKAQTGFGVLGLYQDGTDNRATLVSYLVYQCLDVAEVLRIGTAPAYQGQGLANQLLGAWLDTLACDCLLEVRADNTPAIALYHKLGFTRIHIRRGYYRDAPDGKGAGGACDAWVMLKPFDASKQ